MNSVVSPSNVPVASSFRDPSGFVYRRDGILYRQVQPAGREAYDRLMESGLYEELTAAGLLVPHEEMPLSQAATDGAYKVLRPREVPFVSYPYEWCFGQLQEAARATLEIQRRSLAKGFWLKDASAYNIQFLDGRPVLIDTLSLEPYPEGRPWVAYRQFCQHFLAPLALMSRTDVRLGQLLRVHLDGVPLDLAARLLPRRTWLSLSLALHVHLQARAVARYARRDVPRERVEGRVGRRALTVLIENLRSAVEGLRWRAGGTEWADYYEATHNYSAEAMAEKERLVTEMMESLRPAIVWDLGANTGRFSRIAAARGALTVAWDIDPSCVEENYAEVRRSGMRHLLPLWVDLTNPSPALGWANAERLSFADRGGNVDLLLALGLVHHLAIGNNLPLARVGDFLADLGRAAIVEFVPKEDSQVRRMLATRADVFPDYHRDGFERAVAPRFTVERRVPIQGTCRTLYLLKRTRP